MVIIAPKRTQRSVREPDAASISAPSSVVAWRPAEPIEAIVAANVARRFAVDRWLDRHGR